MADRRMRQIFREAAEIARTVPPEFRQAAFDKAVDLLSGQVTFEVAPDTAGPRETRVKVTGIALPDMLLDKYLEALSYAANKVGLEKVTADQLAELVNGRFAVPATASLVASAIGNAGTIVRTVRQGQKALSGLTATGRSKSSNRPRPEEKVQPKTSARKRAINKDATPGEIVNDLIALGFFATARTTADVLLYLEKQGLEFSTRQLAPVLVGMMRRGMLRRESTADGGYRYRAHKNKQ